MLYRLRNKISYIFILFSSYLAENIWQFIFQCQFLTVWACLAYNSLRCAVPEHTWCTATFASPGGVSTDTVLHLYVCCTWTCLCTRFCVNVLHMYVCFYAAPGRKRACVASVIVCLQELCASPGYVYLQDPMLPLKVYGRLFWLFQYSLKHRNKLKISYLFHETNCKTTETDWVSVLFRFKPKQMYLIRWHPYPETSLNIFALQILLAKTTILVVFS